MNRSYEIRILLHFYHDRSPIYFWENLKETEEIFEVKFLRTYAHSQFAAAIRLNFTHTFLIKV